MAHGYESNSVEEVREILRRMGVDEEFVSTNTKKVLVEKLLELQNGSIDDLEVDETGDESIMAVVDMEALSNMKEEDITPVFGSPLWNEYVLRQFTDEELYDGNPTCDGLRRVAQQLLGPIFSQRITKILGPTRDNNGTSTVCVELTIYNKYIDHEMVIEEVADVNSENTDAPYNKYPSATASSRAEARALRKALQLRNVYAAEEVSEVADTDSGNNWEIDTPIDDSQINVIELLCSTQRLNMNVMDFINSGRKIYSNILEVSKTTAARMIQELNKIQQGLKERPKGIKEYVASWRQ
jgi:hypothetical protein